MGLKYKEKKLKYWSIRFVVKSWLNIKKDQLLNNWIYIRILLSIYFSMVNRIVSQIIIT